MSNRDPDVYALIWLWIVEIWNSHRVMIVGIVMAFFASISQSFLNGKKDTFWRATVEAFLCSLIVSGVLPILDYLDLNGDLIRPISIFIGIYGTSSLRQFILKLIHKKTGEIK